MSVKERLKLFIEYRKINVRKFENSIGVSNSYVSNIFNTIGHDIRNRIIEKYPDLNMDWLLTGLGEMIIPNSNPILDDEKISRNQNSLRDKYILLLEQTVARLEAKIKELTTEA